MSEKPEKPENPPAFPSPEIRGYDGTGICEAQYGMSLRDWFAGQIAAGMASYSGTSGLSYGPFEIAGRSYEVADAMLREREKDPRP